MQVTLEQHIRAFHLVYAGFHHQELSDHARKATKLHGHSVLVYKCPLMGEPFPETADGEFLPSELALERWPKWRRLKTELENCNPRTHYVFALEYAPPGGNSVVLVDVLRYY